MPKSSWANAAKQKDISMFYISYNSERSVYKGNSVLR